MKILHNFDVPARLILPCLGAAVLLNGCGGGGGGSSTPSVPSPYDGTYTSVYTPSDAIPSDGTAPTGTLGIVNGKATFQTTFYLQKSVVDFYQKQINDGLNAAGRGGAIKDNQIPKSIVFNGSSQVDGSGKVIFQDDNTVAICGKATLTVTPTLAANGTGVTGQGNYNISFPSKLTIKVSGQKVSVDGTCNNLPLRTGTVNVTR